MTKKKDADLLGETPPAKGGNRVQGDTGGIAGKQLKSIIERVERLEEEKKALADDIKDIFSEAKANGFDVKTIKAVIKIRKLDKAEREESEALLDMYLHAIGMAPDTSEDEEAEA